MKQDNQSEQFPETPTTVVTEITLDDHELLGTLLVDIIQSDELKMMILNQMISEQNTQSDPELITEDNLDDFMNELEQIQDEGLSDGLSR